MSSFVKTVAILSDKRSLILHSIYSNGSDVRWLE